MFEPTSIRRCSPGTCVVVTVCTTVEHPPRHCWTTATWASCSNSQWLPRGTKFQTHRTNSAFGSNHSVNKSQTTSSGVLWQEPRHTRRQTRSKGPHYPDSDRCGCACHNLSEWCGSIRLGAQKRNNSRGEVTFRAHILRRTLRVLVGRRNKRNPPRTKGNLFCAALSVQLRPTSIVGSCARRVLSGSAPLPSRSLRSDPVGDLHAVKRRKRRDSRRVKD